MNLSEKALKEIFTRVAEGTTAEVVLHIDVPPPCLKHNPVLTNSPHGSWTRAHAEVALWLNDMGFKDLEWLTLQNGDSETIVASISFIHLFANSDKIAMQVRDVYLTANARPDADPSTYKEDVLIISGVKARKVDDVYPDFLASEACGCDTSFGVAGEMSLVVNCPHCAQKVSVQLVVK